MTHDFGEYYAWSKGKLGPEDRLTIKSMLDGVIDVAETDTTLDKQGVDYVATLKMGAKVFIDCKTRRAGCARYWKHGEEELALETWSVMPGGTQRSKIGWTLNTASLCSLILFKFDPVDSDNVFLVSFQLLRVAFRRNGAEWAQRFGKVKEINKTWESECIFVPASLVLQAITSASWGKLVLPKVMV